MKGVSFQTDTNFKDRCATLSFASFPIYSIVGVSHQDQDSYTVYVGGGGGPSKTGIQNGFTSIAISGNSGIPLESNENPFCLTNDTVLGLKAISDDALLAAVGDKVVKVLHGAGEFRTTNPTSESFSLEEDDFIRLVRCIDADKFVVLYSSGHIFSYVADKYERISSLFQLESMSDIKSMDVSNDLIAVTTSTLIHMFPFSVDEKGDSILIGAKERQTIKADAIKSIKIRSFWYFFIFMLVSVP